MATLSVATNGAAMSARDTLTARLELDRKAIVDLDNIRSDLAKDLDLMKKCQKGYNSTLREAEDSLIQLSQKLGGLKTSVNNTIAKWDMIWLNLEDEEEKGFMDVAVYGDFDNSCTMVQFCEESSNLRKFCGNCSVVLIRIRSQLDIANKDIARIIHIIQGSFGDFFKNQTFCWTQDGLTIRFRQDLSTIHSYPTISGVSNLKTFKSLAPEDTFLYSRERNFIDKIRGLIESNPTYKKYMSEQNWAFLIITWKDKTKYPLLHLAVSGTRRREDFFKDLMKDLNNMQDVFVKVAEPASRKVFPYEYFDLYQISIKDRLILLETRYRHLTKNTFENLTFEDLQKTELFKEMFEYHENKAYQALICFEFQYLKNLRIMMKDDKTTLELLRLQVLSHNDGAMLQEERRIIGIRSKPTKLIDQECHCAEELALNSAMDDLKQWDYIESLDLSSFMFIMDESSKTMSDAILTEPCIKCKIRTRFNLNSKNVRGSVPAEAI